MTTDREQVRQQVARRLAALHGYADDADLTGTDWLNQADAVLAVPAIADALTATEQLRRVQALLRDADRFSAGDPRNRVSGDNLRHALAPPLEPLRTGQEQSAVAPPPGRDDDYTAAAINRDQETT